MPQQIAVEIQRNMKLTPWSRVAGKMMMVPVLVKKFHTFVEPQFHYCVKSPPSVPFLSQIKPPHAIKLSYICCYFEDDGCLNVFLCLFLIVCITYICIWVILFGQECAALEVHMHCLSL